MPFWQCLTENPACPSYDGYKTFENDSPVRPTRHFQPPTKPRQSLLKYVHFQRRYDCIKFTSVHHSILQLPVKNIYYKDVC